LRLLFATIVYTSLESSWFFFLVFHEPVLWFSGRAFFIFALRLIVFGRFLTFVLQP